MNKIRIKDEIDFLANDHIGRTRAAMLRQPEALHGELWGYLHEHPNITEDTPPSEHFGMHAVVCLLRELHGAIAYRLQDWPSFQAAE
jgi:hypothetical protein